MYSVCTQKNVLFFRESSILKKDSVPNPEDVLRQQLRVEQDLHTKGQEEVSFFH